MRQRQSGITMIGWIFLLIPVALVGYAAIRLTPVFMNSMKVSKALNQTASEYKGEDQINPTAVRNALEKRFDIDSINFPDVQSVSIARDGDEWVLQSNYEDKVVLFKGISLLVQFDKRAVVEK
jgi:hypothetical protein